MKRKAQVTVSNLAGVAMLLVVVGVVLGMSAYINAQLRDSFPSVSIGCEAVTWTSNSTMVRAAYPYIKDVSAVHNGSTCAAADLLGEGNWSHTDQGIYLEATGSEIFGSGVKYVNYTTWNTSTAYGQGVGMLYNSTSGIGTLAAWLPIISIVLAAAVIIYVLLKSFGGQGGV